MKLVYWGTYDLGKPRNRILLRGLREAGADVIECHADVWTGIEDKSQVHDLSTKVKIVLRWLLAYPALIIRYMRTERHDVVVVGYMGQVDLLVLWPFARLRGVPIVWDAFLSLYNTVVEDRQMVGPKHPAAWVLRTIERLDCRAAARIVLDTQAHAEYFARTLGASPSRLGAVFVGAEPEAFPPLGPKDHNDKGSAEFTVVFYGQFIPLHGIPTIVEAARLTTDEPIRWVVIGQGQEEARMARMLDEQPLPRLTWIPWVPYAELIEWIRRADVCLGIFGASDKAARVIPNKAFQILMAGRPLITRDSPAIRELLADGDGDRRLVPAADPVALADAVRSMHTSPAYGANGGPRSDLIGRITPQAIGHAFLDICAEAAGKKVAA